MGPHARLPSRQRGIAMIMVLWLTIMLTVIASGFAFSMRSEALSARNAMSLAQARTAAAGSIERMAYELSRPRMQASWTADGVDHTWMDGDMTITASAVDESARIDVNSAPEPLLRGLIEHVGGADPDAAVKITDAIQDWRDPDDLRRPNGAEAADYQSAGLPQKPSNAPFETVSEVSRVMGMTPAIFARIADSITVHSRQPGINAALASRDVLLALPAATPEIVDAYLQQRADARAAKLPVPPFPPAASFVAGAVPVWRIRGAARTVDGVTFVREAVIRPSGDARRPLLTLNWREGNMVAAPVAPAETAAAEARK
ncbi:MAG: type II secretion system protein GspK [Burkholderiales bacterium]